MAKAQKVYMGHNTYGRTIQVAERQDGAWFWREYGWNGFGVGWSKWAPTEEPPAHPERVRVVAEYAGAEEYAEIPEAERVHRVEWGFTTLHLVPGPSRVRLPD